MVKDFIKFFYKMKNLKLYLVKFDKNNIIKDKIYLSDCIVDDKNCWLVIIIIYNRYTFSLNDGICKV